MRKSSQLMLIGIAEMFIATFFFSIHSKNGDIVAQIGIGIGVVTFVVASIIKFMEAREIKN